MDLKAEAGVVPRETLLAYDGLTFLRLLIDGKLPPPPIMQTLDFRLVAADQGRVRFEADPQFKHYNPIGVVHGGFAMTMLDSALGCAVHSTLGVGEGYTTIELKVNLTRTILPGMRVRGVGTVLNRGKQLATSEGRIYAEDGKLLAHAVTTCLIFPIEKTRAAA